MGTRVYMIRFSEPGFEENHQHIAAKNAQQALDLFLKEYPAEYEVDPKDINIKGVYLDLQSWKRNDL